MPLYNGHKGINVSRKQAGELDENSSFFLVAADMLLLSPERVKIAPNVLN